MMQSSAQDIIERVVSLGGDRALCAIVSRPTAETRRPAIIIFNTGIIHRVGHHRMYTTLARRLARQGFPVLRFDFAGIGDSPAQGDELSPLEANCESIRAVVDWVQTHLGVERVVLMGLCSGADHSVVYGGDDNRVVGVVLMDPSIPRTQKYHAIDTMKRLRQPVVWTNLVTGRGRFWGKVRHKLAGAEAPPPKRDEQFSRQDMEAPETIAYLQVAYQKMVDNGVSILAVFSGGHSYQHNYRTQILDALPEVSFGESLDLHFLPDCDHTFTYEADRRKLNDLLDPWLQKL